MFSEEPEEQQLYHSIATVASLLLRIGEVGKKFHNGGKKVDDSDVPAPPTVAQVEEAHAEAQSGEPQVCQEATAAKASAKQDKGDVSTGHSPEDVSGGTEQRQGSVLDADWSVTFEQVLASLLTEPPLVDYFERKQDIRSKVEACKAQRAVERQRSSASDHELAQQSH